MAGGDPPNLKPVSESEMYQWTAKALRSNIFAPVERVRDALAATGRAFNQGRFNSLAALARINVGREADKYAPDPNVRLPNEWYRESLSFGSAAYRVTAITEVEYANGQRGQREYTLAFDSNLSPAEWLALADEANERWGRRYGFTVVGTNIVDPRRRTIMSTQ